MNNHLSPPHNYGSGGAPAILNPFELMDFPQQIPSSAVQQIQKQESSADQKTKQAASISEIAAKNLGVVVTDKNAPYVEQLSDIALDRVKRVYNKRYTVNARKYSEAEKKAFTTEQYNLAVQPFPEITFSLKEFHQFIKKELCDKHQIKEGIRIGGSAATHFLIDTPFKDLDVTYYLPDLRGDFGAIKNCILAFIKEKIPSTFNPPVGLDKFAERYLSKSKLVLVKGNYIKSFAIYGFGEFLDVKFAYKSRYARKNVTLSDGFWVDPEAKNAGCMHLGKEVSRERFVKGLDEARHREYVIDKPQEISELIWRISKAMTKGFNVDANYWNLAFELIKKEYPLDKIGVRFQNLLKGEFKQKDEIGRMVFFLNFLQILISRLKLSATSASEGKQYIQAFAKMWMDEPSRKTLQGFTQLLLKFPEDVECLLIIVQGILFRRWMQNDSAIQAYDFEFHPNKNTARMYFSISHALGTQYLRLPYNPPEMLEAFLDSVTLLYRKYQGSDLLLLKNLTHDVRLDKKHPPLASLEELTAEAIEGYECPAITTVLRERFGNIQTIHFYESMQKRVEGTPNAIFCAKKLIKTALNRALEEEQKIKKAHSSPLFAALNYIAEHKPNERQLEKFYRLLTAEINPSIPFSSLLKKALEPLMERLCHFFSNSVNPTELMIVQNILILANTHGFISQKIQIEFFPKFLSSSQKLIEAMFKKGIDVEDAPLVYSTLQLADKTMDLFKKCHPQAVEGLAIIITNIARPWCRGLMTSNARNEKMEWWIAFGLIKILQHTTQKEMYENKDLCLQFLRKLPRSYQVETLKIAEQLIEELLKNKIDFTAKEKSVVVNVVLAGLSSVFFAFNRYVNKDEIFRYFLNILKQLDVESGFIKTMEGLVNIHQDPTSAFKTYFDALITAFPQHAVEISVAEGRYTLGVTEESELEKSLDSKMVDASNSLFARYVKWRKCFSIQNAEHLQEMLELLQGFAKQENGLSIVLNMATLLQNRLQQLNPDTQKVDSLLKHICESLIDIANSNNSYALAISLNEVIKQLHITFRERINSILSRDYLIKFHLNLMEVCLAAEKKPLDEGIQFLLECLKNKDICKNPLNPRIFKLVIQLIQQNKYSSPQMSFELCHAVLHSALISEIWPQFKSVCIELFYQFPFEDKQLRQQTMIKECHAYLQSENCLKSYTQTEVFKLFDYALTVDDQVLAKTLWKRLFVLAHSTSIEEVRKLCKELLKNHADRMVPYIVDAFIKTGANDLVLCECLLDVFMQKPSVESLQLVNDSILAQKVLLKFDVKNQSVLLEKLMVGFKTLCGRAKRNHLMVKPLEVFWNRVNVLPVWKKNPNKSEECLKLFEVWIEISHPTFLLHAYDLLPQLKHMMWKELWVKAFVKLGDKELFSAYRKRDFPLELKRMVFDEILANFKVSRLDFVSMILKDLNEVSSILMLMKKLMQHSCPKHVFDRVCSLIKQIIEGKLRFDLHSSRFIRDFEEYKEKYTDKFLEIYCDLTFLFYQNQWHKNGAKLIRGDDYEEHKALEKFSLLKTLCELILQKNPVKFSPFFTQLPVKLSATQHELFKQFVEEQLEREFENVQMQSLVVRRALFERWMICIPFYGPYQEFSNDLRELCVTLFDFNTTLNAENDTSFALVKRALNHADKEDLFKIKQDIPYLVYLRVNLEYGLMYCICKLKSGYAPEGIARMRYLLYVISPKYLNSNFAGYLLLIQDRLLIECLNSVTNRSNYKNICVLFKEILDQIPKDPPDGYYSHVLIFVQRTCMYYSLFVLLSQISKSEGSSKMKISMKTLCQNSKFKEQREILFTEMNVSEEMRNQLMANILEIEKVSNLDDYEKTTANYLFEELHTIFQHCLSFTSKKNFELERALEERLRFMISRCLTRLEKSPQVSEIVENMRKKFGISEEKKLAKEMTAKLQTAAAPKESGSK